MLHFPLPHESGSVGWSGKQNQKINNLRCVSLTTIHVHITSPVIDCFADMVAILILPPQHPIMLIKMIYSFIVIIEELSQ